MDINKSSGLIFHPTSLPSRYGIGDLGKESYEFVDLLSQSKTSISRSTRRRYSPSRKRRSPTRRRRTPLRRRPVRRNRRRGRGTVKIIKLKGRARLGGNQSLKNLQKMKFQDLRRGVRMFSLL